MGATELFDPQPKTSGAVIFKASRLGASFLNDSRPDFDWLSCP